MAKSIRLSPKHGVNPSISVCFFCGKPKQELVLFGRLKNDEKAPKEVLLDYEPCEACKEQFSGGIPILGVTETPNTAHQLPIQESLYPTGSYLVASEDFIRREFGPELAASGKQAGLALMPEEMVQEIRAAYQKACEENDWDDSNIN